MWAILYWFSIMLLRELILTDRLSSLMVVVTVLFVIMTLAHSFWIPIPQFEHLCLFATRELIVNMSETSFPNVCCTDRIVSAEFSLGVRRIQSYRVILPKCPCYCGKQGHTVWLQVYFMALISWVMCAYLSSSQSSGCDRSIYATPLPFTYSSHDLMFSEDQHKSYYKTSCILASI